MAEKLELPDPGIREAPELDALEAGAEDYLNHVLERWGPTLRDQTEESFEKIGKRRPSWGATYTIDAMAEHAVMHPIRHRFQLEEWPKAL